VYKDMLTKGRWLGLWFDPSAGSGFENKLTTLSPATIISPISPVGPSSAAVVGYQLQQRTSLDDAIAE